MMYLSRTLHRPSAACGATLGTQELRLGFLCPHNPNDVMSFSGTAFHMLRALQDAPGVAVSVLGNHRRHPWPGRLRRLIKPLSFAVSAAETNGLDVILGLTATKEIVELAERTEVPCIHVTDATPAFLREAYGWDVPAVADLDERRALGRAACAVYSSAEMAQRARAEFGPAAAGARAVPFGVNMKDLPRFWTKKPPLSPLCLLWVGSDWTRKGGAMAVAAMEELTSRGVPARLMLVGDVPANVRLPPCAERIGYLNKTRSRDARRLARLFAEAHLLVLPTRADCAPMVIAEANAHGTPVLVTKTGGIPSLMAPEGRNGRILSLDANASDWADAVTDLTAFPGNYEVLSRASFRHARNRLSWAAWAQDVMAIAVDLANSSRAREELASPGPAMTALA